MDITDDSQEVIRYEYVQADADIYVCHSIAYYDTFPLDIEKKVWSGKKKTTIFFQLGSSFLDLSSPLQQNEDRFICRESLFSTGIFQVPFSLGIITTSRFELRKERLTEDAAKKQAIQRLYDYEEKLIEKGVQISENNVKIEINHQDCVSRGTLTVIERTGREAPTEKKDAAKRKDTRGWLAALSNYMWMCRQTARRIFSDSLTSI